MTTSYKFASIIAPYTVEEFFKNYYEKQYLYIRRQQPNYYDNILNADDIDLFFQNKTIPTCQLRIVSKGNELAAENWSRKKNPLVNNDKLFTLLKQGHTLIIRAGDKSIIKLFNYASDLECELKIRLQFNIYITPNNAQGFNAHYDDHDVFIMQTTGTKIWRLYNTAVELPSSKQPYTQNQDKFDLSKPTFQVELKPGDLLYIPRGLVHDAITTDMASVHVSVGLHPNYYYELVQQLAELAQDKVEFRKAIPNGLDSEERQQQFKAEFQSLIQGLMNNFNLDDLRDQKFEQYIDAKTSEDKNRFKDLIQSHKLNLNSVLSRRENILYKIDRDGKNFYLKFYGRKLEFPLFMEHSIKTFLNSKPFAVKEIGGLISDDGRIQLATAFLQEGFLTIEDLNVEG